MNDILHRCKITFSSVNLRAAIVVEVHNEDNSVSSTADTADLCTSFRDVAGVSKKQQERGHTRMLHSRYPGKGADHPRKILTL